MIGCIVFSWDYGTSLPVWNSLKLQPVLSDQIPCFKALITIHKLVVGGPHLVVSIHISELNCVLGFGGSLEGAILS